MRSEYANVITRFLHPNERLFSSDETEMPLVIEADGNRDIQFLKTFLTKNSTQILNDMATYGAVLLRGFDISADEDFEKTVLSIQGFRGISEAFMSEQGRIHVNNLQYVLHTNAVYKTGGTLYLGGFHNENFYTPDVPSYICFCCLKPSVLGGETGLVNMEKVYQHVDDTLKDRLEKNTFFVSKWLVSEVAARYQISSELIKEICAHFNLPIIENDNQQFILMYKPCVFKHPVTKKKSLQINLFEIPNFNLELRKHFINDYQGKTWFWHRFIWRLPAFMLRILELIYIMCASFFYSPKESFQILLSKFYNRTVFNKKNNLPYFYKEKVNTAFKAKEIKDLAKLMRKYYSSCLWQKGDILLVDNRKVMHAGMPGSGDRLVRALIGNPIEMQYTFSESGCLDCNEKIHETIGFYMAKGQLNIDSEIDSAVA